MLVLLIVVGVRTLFCLRWCYHLGYYYVLSLRFTPFVVVGVQTLRWYWFRLHGFYQNAFKVHGDDGGWRVHCQLTRKMACYYSSLSVELSFLVFAKETNIPLFHGFLLHVGVIANTLSYWQFVLLLLTVVWRSYSALSFGFVAFVVVEVHTHRCCCYCVPYFLLLLER